MLQPFQKCWCSVWYQSWFLPVLMALVKSRTRGETSWTLEFHTLLNTLSSVSRVCQDSIIDCFCPARLSVVGRSCPSSGCSAGFSAGPVERCGAQSPDPALVTRRMTEPTGTTQTTVFLDFYWLQSVQMQCFRLHMSLTWNDLSCEVMWPTVM